MNTMPPPATAARLLAPGTHAMARRPDRPTSAFSAVPGDSAPGPNSGDFTGV